MVFSRLKLILILCFLTGSSVLLTAQDMVNDSLRVTEQPVMTQSDTLTQYIASGYNYMLSNEPLLAQREYRLAVEMDSTRLESWQGLLWAFNGLHQWKLTILNAKTAIKLFPYDPRLRYMTAYACWNTYNALKAHQLYRTSLDLATQKYDKTGQIASLEGLGWIYNSFDNYPRARSVFSQAQTMYPDTLTSPGLVALSGFHHNTILAFSRLNKKKTDLSIKQYLTYQAWELSAGFEQFRQDNARYRDAWTAEIGYQFIPVKSTATFFYLTGKGNQYPAYAAQTELSHQFWLSNMMLEPVYRYAFSYYPDFNVYQNDLSLRFYWQKLSTSATVVNIQRDVENPGGDYLDWMVHASVGYPVYKGVRCSLLAGTGKQDWWIIPGGYAVDDFKTTSMYYGNSWLVPVNSKLDIQFYQQFGKSYDIWKYSGTLVLNLKY